jgi:hypothetical protein
VARSSTTYHDWLLVAVFADLIDGRGNEMAILKFPVFTQTEPTCTNFHDALSFAPAGITPPQMRRVD